MGESTCVMQSASSSQVRDLLSESISFGRFMSDTLAYDKWSNLSHKRYVEEAAKYSQPGSVAQKKAFFEAYYKRKALLAAQENAAAAEEAMAQDRQSNDDTVNIPEMQNEGMDSTNVPQQDMFAEQNVIAATETKENQLEILLEVLKVDQEISTATTELSDDSEMEKPLLKDRNSNQEVSSSERKPRPPPVPSLKPAANLWPSAKTPCPLHKSSNRSRKENVMPVNTTSSAMECLEKIKTSPKPLFSYMSRTPARDVSRCVGNSSNGAKDSITPLITPARDANRYATNSSKGAKDSSITPLRTPTVARQAKMSTVTPKSGNRRIMTPLESTTPGTRTTGAKWRYFGGLDFSTCLSTTCRNKSRPSPTASSPFNFRTRERAVKRKEKLELKFNEKAPQKVQLQTKLKEKTECELKRLRQSLCFRARPLPSFYKERKTQKDNLTTNPAEAPRRIAKDASSTLIPPPTPQTQRPCSSQKNKANVIATKKSSKGLTHPRSLAAMISIENNSPKIEI